MDEELKQKAETFMYFLTKTAARNSFVEFVEEDCCLTMDDWRLVKDYITEKTGIEFKYL
tara:strand:+ start:2460 stop:2636 length:177 start_codon:yes stop_codon:yes gene_type:complete